MKAILQSIKPQYCELIAAGKKTIEVRKTKPKIKTPFKVYIYCTKGEKLWKKGNSVFLDKRYNRLLQTFDYMLNGKIIAESGLQSNFEHANQWGHEETMIDWIAIQFPKILKTFEKIGCYYD